MASRKVTPDEPKKSRGRPAITSEDREIQVIAAAYDLAERQIREGTASSQVISHFLKLGSSREKLEQERLANENRLLDAKAEQIASQKRVEELFEDAIAAFKGYRTSSDDEEPHA